MVKPSFKKTKWTVLLFRTRAFDFGPEKLWGLSKLTPDHVEIAVPSNRERLKKRKTLFFVMKIQL